MPFLGKDWRSCGDRWIRTENGWERSKVLECILDNLSIGLRRENIKNKHKSFMCERNKRINSECCECEDDMFSVDTNENKNVKETSIEKSSSGKCEFYLEDENNNDENTEKDKPVNKQMEEEEDDDQDIFDELDFTSDDNEKDDQTELNMNNNDNSTNRNLSKMNKKHCNSLSKLSISNSSIERYYYKTRQPHIIYFDFDTVNNRNNSSKVSVSEVLNALDMPGAVRDIKRFNYVCRLVQIIINEKLRSLSGNAQRTLFMIVKQMLIQVIKKQENLNVMRKLLVDFKKKIQESYYYYFYYIGSQKLWEKHVATINRWQEMLDNPNHKRVKRLINNYNKKTLNNTSIEHMKENKTINNSSTTQTASFENIPIDCKLEIMRRLNTGLDLVNLSKCNQNLNKIISKELAIWQNLCKYHFQQTHINSLLNKCCKVKNTNENEEETSETNVPKELDWKLMYFRLKRRYGHREVYVDMIHKCFYCKCLFWKELGHPCIIAASISDQDSLEAQTEPITPKKLIDLLIK